MVPPRVLAIGGLTTIVAHATSAPAQHQHGEGPPGQPHAEEVVAHEPAEMTGVLGIPMTRQGSGTAWLPDHSPMRAFHATAGGWNLMLHGNLFVGYDYQTSDAGHGVVSQNWVMGMASRPLAGGVFTARMMLSLEPLTLGKDGYPLLLQTGEAVEGEPLVDRQHPHDLFMELAADYQRELADGVAFELYGALAGEPALGPVGFPHRPSSMPDPLAPLGHHWQDSTHITFGVVTAGVFTRTAKLEASWFNGREPDEERYDLDLRGFDSYAGRLSVNPSRAWSLQGSYGYLESPEVLEPEVSVHRVTASATHAMPLGGEHGVTSTLVWGRNMPSEGPSTDSMLAESALDQGTRGVTFARAEYVEKTGHDFDFPAAMSDQKLPIVNVSIGHVHPILELSGIETSLGVRAALAYVDDDLRDRYGTRTPVGVMVYVQVQPATMH